MTEQLAAGDGQKTVPAKRAKSKKPLVAAIHDSLTDAGFVQGSDGVYTPPPGFAERAGEDAPPRDHNRQATESDDRLRLLIERIERLEEEKKGIGDDIKDVYGVAKATGYDPKIMRRIVRLRKIKPDDRREAEAVLATYCASLGMDIQPSLF